MWDRARQGIRPLGELIEQCVHKLKELEMTTEKIKQIPVLPHQIVDAINRNSLAVFMGAGVSKVVGCAGWGDLK